MKHLTSTQISELQTALQDKLAKLGEYQQSVREDSPVQDSERGENNELSEESREAYDMLASEVLENESESLLQEVQTALERIHEGTYGLDVVTGEPIPFLRLKLMPWATTNADTPVPSTPTE